MALREELERQGNWLFRWRSYILPIALIFLLPAVFHSRNLEEGYGGARDDMLTGFCLVLSFFGLAIRCFTVGHVPKDTSGRNTREQIADSLNTTGTYSILRHPLYFGNFIIYLGIILSIQVWWLIPLVVLAILGYLERIMLAEEGFLRGKFGDAYLQWANRTPTYWPRFKQWRPPCLPFSFKNVLKREYTGLFAIIATFTLLEALDGLVAQGTLNLGLGWRVFFFAGLLIYLTLRTLKKKTTVLDVEGR